MLGASKKGGTVVVLSNYDTEVFKDMVTTDWRNMPNLYIPMSRTSKGIVYYGTRSQHYVNTTEHSLDNVSTGPMGIIDPTAGIIHGSPQAAKLSTSNPNVGRIRTNRLFDNGGGFEATYFRSWSLEFWINTAGVETGWIWNHANLQENEIDGDIQKRSIVSVSENKIAYTGFRPNAGGQETHVSNSTLAAGTTYHIVVMMEELTLKIYINGVKDKEVVTTLNLSSTQFWDAAVSWINLRAGYVYFNRINGTISNVALYRKALTENQIITHYKIGAKTINADPDYDKVVLLLGGQGYNGSTTIVDHSKKTKKIFPKNGAAITTAQGKFPGTSSIAFNGNNSSKAFSTSQHLTFPNYSDLNLRDLDFTVETWLRFNTAPFQHGGATILSLPRWTAGTPGLAFVVQIDSGYTRLKAYINTGADDLQPEVPFTPIANTWYHLALCRTGSMLNFFINGVKIGTGTNIGSGAIPPIVQYASVGAWVLWNDISSGNTMHNLNGQLQDLRVTKGLARYTVDFTPPTAPLPNN